MARAWGRSSVGEKNKDEGGNILELRSFPPGLPVMYLVDEIVPDLWARCER